jgi:hypothetical protein
MEPKTKLEQNAEEPVTENTDERNDFLVGIRLFLVMAAMSLNTFIIAMVGIFFLAIFEPDLFGLYSNPHI